MGDSDTENPVAKPLSSAQIGLYSSFVVPLTIVSLPLTVYLPKLYGELGINLALMGIVLLVARVSDVVTDPIIGILSDKTRSRIGRRKPWLIFGALPLMATTYLLFVPPDDVSLAYFIAVVILTYLAVTIVDIPYYSGGAEMSGNYHERSRITVTRESFRFFGFLLAALIPAISQEAFGVTELRDQVFFLAIGICALMPIVTILANVFVPEPKIPETPIQRFTFEQYKKGFRFMMRNGPYVRILIGFTGTVVGTSVDSVVSFFFCEYVLLAEASYQIALVGMMIAAMMALPGWLYLSKRIGKHKTFVVSVVWYVSCAMLMPLLYFVPDWSGDGFIALQTLKGVCAGAIGAMAFSMAADAIDIDTIKSGEPRTAFYLATWSAAQKIAVAFASFLGLTLVSLFGFDPTLEAGLSQAEGGNTNLALIGIALLYTVIPSCFYLVTLPWIWSYSLTEERQSRIRERLERRHIARHDDLAGINNASMKPIAGSLDHGISDAGGSE